jgi:signal transduction histidine kinase
VTDLLSEILSGLLDEVDARRIRLDVQAPLPLAHADPGLLERVLLNLLGNALKYTAGEICVSVVPLRDDICVRVSDSGPGIPTEDLPLVFKRYYRGRTGRDDGLGLGLGLFIVRMLVEAQRGRVWVERAGEGTAFSFTIPAVAPGLDAPTPTEPPPAGRAGE